MLSKIPVKLPDSFEDALGYHGCLRWVAFYWEPCGDEAMYDDGFGSGDGNWWGYKSFVDHPSVMPLLASYDLGSSDSEAKHWLLCDLKNREVFVGERKEVREFLYGEVKKCLPEAKQAEVSSDDIQELLATMKAELTHVRAPSVKEIEEKMRREQEAVVKMVAALC